MYKFFVKIAISFPIDEENTAIIPFSSHSLHFDCSITTESVLFSIVFMVRPSDATHRPKGVQ